MIEMEVSSLYTDELLTFLGTNYAKVFSRVWESAGRRVGVFIHEEYVFRTGSYQTLTTIVDEVDISTCKITVVGSGGGGGLFNISWGSQSAGERTLQKHIQRITGQTANR